MKIIQSIEEFELLDFSSCVVIFNKGKLKQYVELNRLAVNEKKQLDNKISRKCKNTSKSFIVLAFGNYDETNLKFVRYMMHFIRFYQRCNKNIKFAKKYFGSEIHFRSSKKLMQYYANAVAYNNCADSKKIFNLLTIRDVEYKNIPAMESMPRHYTTVK